MVRLMTAADQAAREHFRAVFEPATGWADQAQLDAAFKAVPPTQRQVIVKLATTGGTLVRLPGGFWTLAGGVVSAAGIPDWWVTWQTVRAMTRKGLLVRTNQDADAWKDPRTLPAQPKAVR